MKGVRFARRLGYSLVGMVVVTGFSWSSGALAQGDQTHAATRHQASTSGHNDRTSAFVKIVRESTKRFQDVSVALDEGYVPMFGCVSGSHEGAMGVHLVNFPMVLDPKLDVTEPELLVYEPISNGRLRLVAADYLVLSEAWHAVPNPGPPELMGQLFHLFESPNRFKLPEFYTLHVWSWKENPQGTFANWNPRVSCDEYTGQNP